MGTKAVSAGEALEVVVGIEAAGVDTEGEEAETAIAAVLGTKSTCGHLRTHSAKELTDPGGLGNLKASMGWYARKASLKP